MSTSYSLVKVGPKEVRGVVDLLKRVFDINEVRTFKLVDSRISSDRHLIMVAKVENTVVGLIECSILKYNILSGGVDRGVIHTLYVEPEYRRLGIAGRLISTSRFWFVSQGVDWVVSDVNMDQDSLIQLFEKQGFDKYQYKMRLVLPKE